MAHWKQLNEILKSVISTVKLTVSLLDCFYQGGVPRRAKNHKLSKVAAKIYFPVTKNQNLILKLT